MSVSIYLINKNTPETRYSGVLKNTAASLFERRSSIQKREEERSRTKRTRDAFCSMPAGFPVIDRSIGEHLPAHHDALQFSLVVVITPMVRAPAAESPLNPRKNRGARFIRVTGRDFTIHCSATCDISMTLLSP